MNPVSELVPLGIFFLTYQFYDIYVATGSLMAASTLMLISQWLKFGRVDKVNIITFTMIIVFGSLTLLLQDDAFIKWKVTLIYALFAAILWLGHFIFDHCLLKQLLGSELKLPPAIWRRLTHAWAGFFLFCALLNLYIAFYLPLSIWVNFKVFGLLLLMLVFIAVTGLYIYKSLPTEEKE
ncbi:septation protein A [Motilimonas sp. KMU-193]|uniref:septation protein A n=1 Tax=Motilimonas sp. KMU-193 TaxID=3388668 RepID=UPI00396B1C83